MPESTLFLAASVAVAATRTPLASRTPRARLIPCQTYSSGAGSEYDRRCKRYGLMRSLARVIPHLKRHSRICLLVVAAAVVGGGAWAIAAVPDSHGVIHACYPVRSPGSKVPTANATLRVIDPSTGQSCNTAAGAAVPEASISWNQIGR